MLFSPPPPDPVNETGNEENSMEGVNDDQTGQIGQTGSQPGLTDASNFLATGPTSEAGTATTAASAADNSIILSPEAGDVASQTIQVALLLSSLSSSSCCCLHSIVVVIIVLLLSKFKICVMGMMILLAPSSELCCEERSARLT